MIRYRREFMDGIMKLMTKQCNCYQIIKLFYLVPMSELILFPLFYDTI